METPIGFLSIHGSSYDHETSDPASHLSEDLQTAIEEGNSVEKLIADLRERVKAETDSEMSRKLGELLTYEKYLQKKRIDKAA